MRTSHVSSLGLETAFKKSGREIGTLMTSVDQGFATLVIYSSDCIKFCRLQPVSTCAVVF